MITVTLPNPSKWSQFDDNELRAIACRVAGFRFPRFTGGDRDEYREQLIRVIEERVR